MNEIAALEKQIAAVKATKTRTYKVSFEITFRADRTDDLADPDFFQDHVKDAFNYFNLSIPEEVSNVVVTEV